MTDEVCPFCLTGWKFDYMRWALSNQLHNKYSINPYKDVVNYNDYTHLPSNLFNDFKSYKSQILYRDEDILIFEDVEQDHPWHILVCPSNHLDIQELILDNELMIKIYSACDMIVRLVDDLQEAKGFLRFMQGLSFKKSLDSYGVKHAHMHLICDNDIDLYKIKDKMFHEFYKESEIYRKYKEIL